MKTTAENVQTTGESGSLVKRAKRGPKVRMSRKAAEAKSGMFHILYRCPNCEAKYEEVGMVFSREYLCAACDRRMMVTKTKVD